MTSFGRGRGWSIQNPNKEQVLRRPGSATCGNNFVKDIIDKIVTYDIHEHISPQLIQEITDLLTSAVNKDSLKDTCDNLWKQAILYDSLTTKIGVIFSDYKIALIEDNNKENIRSRFLRLLQDNYMSREKYKIQDKKKFANIVLLHAEVFYHMKLSDGSKLKILAEPLIQYLEDLLQDNIKENTYFIMIQILRSGKDLHTICPDRFENLMLIIRQILVKESSSQNRAMLLLMIELVNNKYEIKDMSLKHFYLSNIKGLSFEYPFSQKELKIVAETKTENDNELQEIDNNQRIIKEIKNDLSEQASYSKNPNIPRAIRGSGGLDTSRKGDNINTKLNSLKITSRQKNNKGWDHDDRFHKDYE
ncbi:uncharacterized protein LOC126848209 [Cataglyphis hispanica]|uniref:uncharacterized protein LOC126848209 n=1 Tax=Cataglyphis hispanica TaxID=1086592 RepID=UPI0021807728|nr:uncharacterized protein LOC126848209 [Cataglyphis hispanica]XP_050444853.1 uncharacterized protein LOC126848209 [Cataglyphis hispanica]XP_050444854.1 uncharacterized protein LOC126848209 [Cataglyphis hispanica]